MVTAIIFWLFMLADEFVINCVKSKTVMLGDDSWNRYTVHISQVWVFRNQVGCEEVGSTDNIFALAAAGLSPMEKKWPV